MFDITFTAGCQRRINTISLLLSYSFCDRAFANLNACLSKALSILIAEKLEDSQFGVSHLSW